MLPVGVAEVRYWERTTLLQAHGTRVQWTDSSMVSAVILAAGASTRMGQPKLLLPLGDEPIVRRTVRQICDAGFEDVLVIVGNEHERMLSCARGTASSFCIEPPVRNGYGQLVPYRRRAFG